MTMRVRLGEGFSSRRRIAAAAAVVCLVALGGCGRGALGGQAAAGDAPTFTDRTFEFLVSAGSVQADQRSLTRATELLVRRCMGAHGLRYYLSPVDAEDRDQGPVRALVSLDPAAELAQRRKSGYGLSAFLTASRRGGIPKTDEYVRTLSIAERARYDRVMFGTDAQRFTLRFRLDGAGGSLPGGGCQASAERRVYGSVRAAGEMVFVTQHAAQYLRLKTDADAAVLTAFDRWASCMHDKTGRQWATPGELVKELRLTMERRGLSRRLRRLEIKRAVQDEACTEATRLDSTYLDVFHQQAALLPVGVQQRIVSLASTEKAAARRAKALLKRWK